MQRLAPLLSKAQAQRWQELELEASLRQMGDVVFCPRCSSTCIEVVLFYLATSCIKIRNALPSD